MIMLAILLAGISMNAWSQPKDNLGKEFFLAFPENVGSDETENLFDLYITSPVPATGYVEVPALNYRRNFTTTPGQITTINLPNGRFGSPTVEILTIETVLSGMSVHIVADTEVAVYGMSHKRYSSDAFMALPVDVLGTEYRAVCYQSSLWNEPKNGSPIGPPLPSEFIVVAVQDSTLVTITPSALTAGGKPANVPFKVLLNKGDCYLVQGEETQRNNDLTGTLIESELPIAVLSGHVRTGMPEGYNNQGTTRPSRDHLIEQLPPVSAWGDSAFVIPFATSDEPDLVRIISSEDGNTITVNGVAVGTFNAGQFYELKDVRIPLSIKGTNPIQVSQYMHTSRYPSSQTPGSKPAYGDPAMTLVYPVEQFATSYTFISVVDASAFLGNFVNIVVEQGGVAGMLLDGNPIQASSFSPIPGTTYVYAQLALNQGTHNISGPKPFGITVYALGNVDSYAYTGGTLLKTITPFKTADIIIDFGDRLLNQADLSGFWDTTVFLHNISSDPLTISDFPMRTGDITKFKVTSPVPPHSISAGKIDSMTIRFEPREANRRMHTTLNAKTEHLRAYVVDVYGRGVLGSPMSYIDSAAKVKIDTIYFGINGESSPPVDTICYLGNTGSGALKVHKAVITGPNAADFSITGMTDSAEGVLNLPFWVGRTPVSQPSKIHLRFTPSPPRSARVAYLDINEGDLSWRRVVLLAHVDTVTVATLTPIAFDSIFICETEEQTITIHNNNTFPVTVERMTLTGANEFSILDRLPIVIPPMSDRKVRIRFAPNNPGIYTASIIAYIDIPKNSQQTLTFTAVAKQPLPAFFAPRNIHILAEEEVLYPIYAKVELSKFQSSTYTLSISYDPTHLTDVDIVQDNTLSMNGYFQIGGLDAGVREYNYTSLTGNIIGGGAEETRPLIYIKFRSMLEGADRLSIFDAVDINYNVVFPNSPIPTYCQPLAAEPGRITIDSSCATVHIVKRLGDPLAAYIYNPMPNPSIDVVKVRFDIPSEMPVELQLTNALGEVTQIVRDVRRSGSYEAVINTQGLAAGAYTLRFRAGDYIKLRKLMISR